MFLISRAELYRMLGLDNETPLLILGPDKVFEKWIEIGVGQNSLLSGEVPKSGVFPIILNCDPERFDTSSFSHLLAREGAVWEIRKGISGPGEWIPLDGNRVILKVI